jgi:hypothetical protein
LIFQRSEELNLNDPALGNAQKLTRWESYILSFWQPLGRIFQLNILAENKMIFKGLKAMRLFFIWCVKIWIRVARIDCKTWKQQRLSFLNVEKQCVDIWQIVHRFFGRAAIAVRNDRT